MTVKTFIIEWDDEVPCTMIIAEHTLKMKAQELRTQIFQWADQEIEKYEY